MKKIKFMLEYHCHPVWVESEEGELLENGLPMELLSNKELVELLEGIANRFDDLYENNDIVFEYHGFSNESERQAFFATVLKAIDLLKNSIANNYLLQVDFDEVNY